VIQTAERRAEADGIVKVVIKDRVAEVTLCVAPRDLREATQCTSFFAVSVPALAIALRRTPQMQANIQEREACTLRFTGVSMEQETAPDNTRKSVFEIEGLQVDLHQPRTCVVLASMPETGRPFLRLKVLRSDVAAAGHDLPMLNVMLGRFEVNVTHTIIKHFSLIYEDLFPHAIGMSFERAAADAGKEYHLLCTQPPEACSKFTVDRFNFADFNSLWFIRINLQEAGYLPNWVRVVIQMASFSVTSEFSVEGLSTKIPQFSPMITDYRGSMGGFISEFGARLLSLAQKRAASVLKHSNIFRMKDLYKIFLGVPDQKWTLDVRASPPLCERTRAGHWKLVENSVAGASGLTAPLTEEGFQSVWHEPKDPEEMALFVRRILADVGHEVKWRTKDPLKRWVSDMKGTKSLASLKKELFFARIGMWHQKANLSHLDHFLASKRTYECRFQFDEDGDASE